MLINFYLSCKKPSCSKFIHFQTRKEAFDPINGECLLSDQQRKCYAFTCKKCSTETSVSFDKFIVIRY